MKKANRSARLSTSKISIPAIMLFLKGKIISSVKKLQISVLQIK